MSELISIIIPNFNKAPYLRECLDSVLAQTYGNWECIIVDDHSTDNSWKIIEDYSILDSRFKVFIRSNHLPKGGNSCRNFALENSLGQYIVFLDSDDLLKPTCLEKRLEVVTEFPKFDFYVFNVELFNNFPGDLKILWNVEDNESDIDRFLKTDGLWQTSGPIYKRDFLVSIKGFDMNLKIWQDYELHFRSILLTNNYLKRINFQPDVFIRQSTDSLSNRSTYFGKKKILLQRIEIYFDLLSHYFLKIPKPNYYLVFSVIFVLSSDVFIKYGNWTKFYNYWRIAFKRRYISWFRFISGVVIAPVLRLSNRIPFIINLLPSSYLIPDFKLLKRNRIGTIEIKDVDFD